MSKRYQVFISSTFEDLREERRAVQEALLGARYIPVAMEWFGAEPATSWDVIKHTIDMSDFCVLILGFCYGSEFNGLSYTEHEYDYAIRNGVPVLAFIQDRNASVPETKRESNPDAEKKLNDFVNRVEKQCQCDFWNSSHDLQLKIIQSLCNSMFIENRPGWYRFPTAIKRTSVGKSHYVFISASPRHRAESMRSDASQQEDLPFREELMNDDVVHCWDILKDICDEWRSLTIINEQIIEPIRRYLNGKFNELTGVSDVAIFYAGPSGLAMHIGCFIANMKPPLIYQFHDHYMPLGRVSKRLEPLPAIPC
jgi:hypothetical protein